LVAERRSRAAAIAGALRGTPIRNSSKRRRFFRIPEKIERAISARNESRSMRQLFRSRSGRKKTVGTSHCRGMIRL